MKILPRQLTSQTAPANEALKPEKILFDDDIAKWNPYRGEPRPEMDEAWHELLKYSNIRVSAEDLKAINRTSVKLSDGSGMYMSELNVYHQLHCLKMIRQSMRKSEPSSRRISADLSRSR